MIINRIKIDKSIYLKFLDNIKYVMYAKISNSNKVIYYSPTKILTTIAYLPGFILASYFSNKMKEKYGQNKAK